MCVTITCADADNTQTPIFAPPPFVSIHRTKSFASHIILPVIPSALEKENQFPLGILGAAVAIVLIVLVVFLASQRKKSST